MRKLKQPNGASCLPTAFASILNVDTHDIFKYLGHDGTEWVWPETQPPTCYRSFHIQEMYEYALTRNYAVTTLAPRYATLPPGVDEPYVGTSKRFSDYLNFYRCVLSGVSDKGNAHAVAWDGKRMMDPAIGDFINMDFTINHIHIVSKIK